MDKWIAILSAVAQLGVAASVAYIAWQSYKVDRAGYYVNKDQLRLSLFDRRYKVFDAFRTYLMNFMVTAKIDYEKFGKFVFDTADAEFLFGREVREYRENVIDNSVRLRRVHIKLEKGIENEDERRRFAEESEKLEEWLAAQDDHFTKLFKKYLHFSIDAEPKS